MIPAEAAEWVEASAFEDVTKDAAEEDEEGEEGESTAGAVDNRSVIADAGVAAVRPSPHACGRDKERVY